MLKLWAPTLGFGVDFQPRGAQGMSFVPLKMKMGPFLWQVRGRLGVGGRMSPLFPAAAPCPLQGQEEEGAGWVLPQRIHPKVIEVLSHFWGVWLWCERPAGTLAAALTMVGLGIIFTIIYYYS